MKKQAASTDQINVDFVLEKRKSISSEELSQSDRRKSTRKSIRLNGSQMPVLSESEIDASANRYNLRSRLSQVTKPESPLPSSILKSSRKSKRVSLYPKPEIIEFDTAMDSTIVKETESPTPFESNPLADASNVNVMSPTRPRESMGGYKRESMSSTPFNAIRTKARQSIGMNLNPIDVAKSPLLKLAFISSHGKRMSLSTNINTSQQF